ncbi:MAG: hypothetical protein WAL04_07020, partial [Acidimicrobiales bacterium]
MTTALARSATPSSRYDAAPAAATATLSPTRDRMWAGACVLAIGRATVDVADARTVRCWVGKLRVHRRAPLRAPRAWREGD